MSWRALNYLVPEPDCDTRNGVVTVWRDARPQPSDAEIAAVQEADIVAAELEQQALDLSDVKRAVTSVLEINYENTPELQAAFATIGDYKTAVKDRYKSKL